MSLYGYYNDEDYYEDMMDTYGCNGNCDSCFEYSCPFCW